MSIEEGILVGVALQFVVMLFLTVKVSDIYGVLRDIRDDARKRAGSL